MSALDRGAAPFGGGQVAFRGLSAADQLRLEQLASGNRERLEALGLQGEEAQALAHNAALLFLAADTGLLFETAFSPILLYDAGELAALARLYADWADGLLEYGRRADDGEVAGCLT